METNEHRVRTVLVIEKSVDNAMELQDHLSGSGNVIFTAYSSERALQMANNAILDCAVIDFEFGDADQIVSVLKRRSIPFIFHAGRIVAQHESALVATRV